MNACMHVYKGAESYSVELRPDAGFSLSLSVSLSHSLSVCLSCMYICIYIVS